MPFVLSALVLHDNITNARSLVRSLVLIDARVLAGSPILLRKDISVTFDTLKIIAMTYFLTSVASTNNVVVLNGILLDTTVTK